MGRAGMNFDFTGLLQGLEKAGRSAIPAAKVGLYETAGIVADAIAAAARQLPLDSSTANQIAESVGIADMETTPGGVNTAISFDGYFEESGFPIIYFVREYEKGTSWMQPHPFQRRAAQAAMARAEAEGNKKAAEFAQRILDNLKDT